MYKKQTFAYIHEEKVKVDTVKDNYEIANQEARELFGNTAFAVDSTMYSVSEGDYYKEGVFYLKDGVTPIPREHTPEEDASIALADAKKNAANVEYMALMANIEL